MHCNRLFGLDWAAEDLTVGLLRRVRGSYRHATADVDDLDEKML